MRLMLGRQRHGECRGKTTLLPAINMHRVLEPGPDRIGSGARSLVPAL